jgi:NADH-quinone oxidoreductase subunit I
MAKTKVIERKPLTLAEKTFIPQIVGGLKTTVSTMLKKPVTLQYPEERPNIPDGYRGVPTLVKDPNGREKCVSCQLCEFVCPPKAIRIEPGEIDAVDDPLRAHVEKAPKEFDINMLRCIYCGLCEEVCPEEAIFLQDVFSSSGYTREEMINNKDKLYELGGTLPDHHYKWDKKKAAEEKGSAAH